MAKKNVTIRYLKAEFITSSIKEQKRSLSALLVDAFASSSFQTAQSRLMSVQDVNNTYLLIPEYTSNAEKDIYGLIVELSDVMNPILSIKSLKESTIKIEELYKEIEADGHDSQAIKNICYFFISKNNVVIQSVKSLTSKDFSLYLNWLVERYLKEDVAVVLKTPINNQNGVMKQIREISIADVQMMIQRKRVADSVAESSHSHDLAITKRGLIKSILSMMREEGQLPDYIPDELIKVSLKLTVDQRKWQKHKDEEKVQEALEVNCRHIAEDVVVKLQDGSTVTAAELHFKKTFPLEHTPGNYPNATELMEKMQAYLKEVLYGYAY